MRYLKIYTSRPMQNPFFRHSGLARPGATYGWIAIALIYICKIFKLTLFLIKVWARDPESRKSLKPLDPPAKPGNDDITAFVTFYKGLTSIFAVLVILFSLVLFTSCDSGKKAVDDVTGNTAVKQYQKSEDDVKAIADKQSERLGTIPGNEDKDEEIDKE